jgi:hypothetical protein
MDTVCGHRSDVALEGWIHVDRPARRPRTAPQASERQSSGFEVPHHVVTGQAAQQATGAQADEVENPYGALRVLVRRAPHESAGGTGNHRRGTQQ